MPVTTTTAPFRAPPDRSEVITLLPAMVLSSAWLGTSDHGGVIVGRLVTAPDQTTWYVPFASHSATPSEEVTRLRDRISELAGLNKQDIARGMGVDRRSLSGYVAGEIRPTELRLRALRLLAEAAEWANARYGVHARDVLRSDLGEGAVLDLVASGRTLFTDEMERSAAALGLNRRDAVQVRARVPARDPLYLKARATWASRHDTPAIGGRVRDPALYEQDLTNAVRTLPNSGRPRRKQI